jgi:HCOMODA/2-hydroxy-3-carboxy-muconic semialdehyde decarboxylase
MDRPPFLAGDLVQSALIDDLVAASRILARNGVFDAWGHISVRRPGYPERYLMARARAAALVGAEDILELDLDSNPIEAKGDKLFLERFIHGEIYRARPDVHAVVHSHSPSVLPFSVTDEPLRAITHNSAFLACGCPVFDVRDVGLTQGLLITSQKQAAALAKSLGNCAVALMRGHGNVIVAQDIAHVVHRAIYTEINARQLATALSFNRPIKYIELDEAEDPKRLADAWTLWKSEVFKL